MYKEEPLFTHKEWSQGPISPWALGLVQSTPNYFSIPPHTNTAWKNLRQIFIACYGYNLENDLLNISMYAHQLLYTVPHYIIISTHDSQHNKHASAILLQRYGFTCKARSARWWSRQGRRRIYLDTVHGRTVSRHLSSSRSGKEKIGN
ncbi:hypothetical protein Sjap_021943 [Stephania japonica]|uniref:Uncharacterized protein n=1 Tax=Stephania japonica TaxID=461633 RepID=A0AAP0ENE1_9MAGN